MLCRPGVPVPRTRPREAPGEALSCSVGLSTHEGMPAAQDDIRLGSQGYGVQRHLVPSARVDCIHGGSPHRQLAASCSVFAMKVTLPPDFCGRREWRSAVQQRREPAEEGSSDRNGPRDRRGTGWQSDSRRLRTRHQTRRRHVCRDPRRSPDASIVDPLPSSPSSPQPPPPPPAPEHMHSIRGDVFASPAYGP